MSSGINVVAARQWYGNHGLEQYGATEVDRYDRAARVLSDRETFGEVFAGQVAASGPDSGPILEIAAGTGLISKALSRRFDGNVIHADLVREPLEIFVARIAGATALQADFCALPFRSASFGTVVGVGSYRYVSDETRESFWEEMHRVTQPDGSLFIAQFYPRGFRLQGSDIARDTANGAADGLFELQAESQHDARAKLGPLSVKSGVYRSFQFTRV